MTFKKWWNELADIYGGLCFYCKKEIATSIDHVVPYSWDQDNYLDNLVPACTPCNPIAGNKMFDDIESKRRYILKQRESRRNMRAICIDCLLPFTYRRHSPSLFLCAECYDAEYLTEYSKTTEWKRWIEQLRTAGIPAEAHREIRKKVGWVYDKNQRVMAGLLVDEYAKIIESDDKFAELLMLA
jgi:hypothetical protein